jgi:hypothetical protein
LLVAVSVVETPAQIVGGVLKVNVGNGFTIKTNEFEQPVMALYVIVVVPTKRAVTTPVEGLIVATEGFDDDQGVLLKGLWLAVSVLVVPTHIPDCGVIVGLTLVTVNV